MYTIDIAYAWKPITVDVLDFNFKKIGTKRIWLRSYFIDSVLEEEIFEMKPLNNGNPYTLEWMLKRRHRFY